MFTPVNEIQAILLLCKESLRFDYEQSSKKCFKTQFRNGGKMLIDRGVSIAITLAHTGQNINVSSTSAAAKCNKW